MLLILLRLTLFYFNPLTVFDGIYSVFCIRCVVYCCARDCVCLCMYICIFVYIDVFSTNTNSLLLTLLNFCRCVSNWRWSLCNLKPWSFACVGLYIYKYVCSICIFMYGWEYMARCCMYQPNLTKPSLYKTSIELADRSSRQKYGSFDSLTHSFCCFKICPRMRPT